MTDQIHTDRYTLHDKGRWSQETTEFYTSSGQSLTPKMSWFAQQSAGVSSWALTRLYLV